MTDLLSHVPKERGDVFIEMANEWMYARRSTNIDFGVRVEERLFASEEARTRARHAFLTHIKSSITHELKTRPSIRDGKVRP